MTIDFTTGEYRNIRIHNVESLHGEANGLTVYKESYISLEHVLVRNVSAGSKLDGKKVDELIWPNLVPRACPVDIHQLTQISYGDEEAQAEENIVFEHVVGFEVCDQFGTENKEAWVGTVGVDDDPVNMLYVVALVFLSTTISIVMYALVLSSKCFGRGLYEELERQKPVVYESEYTPLVQYL